MKRKDLFTALLTLIGVGALAKGSQASPPKTNLTGGLFIKGSSDLKTIKASKPLTDAALQQELNDTYKWVTQREKNPLMDFWVTSYDHKKETSLYWHDFKKAMTPLLKNVPEGMDFKTYLEGKKKDSPEWKGEKKMAIAFDFLNGSLVIFTFPDSKSYGVTFEPKHGVEVGSQLFDWKDMPTNLGECACYGCSDTEVETLEALANCGRLNLIRQLALRGVLV